VPPPDDSDLASLLADSERACLQRDYTAGAALARQALVLAREPGAEPSWEAEAAYRLVRCGALAEGDAVLHRMLAAASVAGDWTIVARACSTMSEIALAKGDINLAIQCAHRALAAVTRLGRPDWGLVAGLALAHAACGDLAEAQLLVDQVLAGDVPISVEFVQLPAAWIDLERGELERVGARISRLAPVRSLRIATFTMALLLIHARWRLRVGDPRGALEALDEADSVSGDLIEPGRPDRLIVRARAAAALGEVAMISAVRRDLDDLVDRGGSGLIRAGAEWASGLWAHRRGQPREARRRLRAAAELCEQASRYVLAVEAWCDLAAVAVDGEGRDLRAMALERARQLADGRELVALKARIGELERDDSVEARTWPAAFDALAPRQREIAVLVAEGITNRQIGERLFLSEHTVRNQLVQIFDKLGVARRSELVALAARSAIARNGS
jgi:DNA-binding CsgD family transcriptional regulator